MSDFVKQFYDDVKNGEHFFYLQICIDIKNAFRFRLILQQNVYYY